MRDCVGKENYKVGLANLSAKIAGTLGKYLAFTAEFLADFFIAAVHSVMPTHDYNTQCCFPPFVSLLQLEFFGVAKTFLKQKECWLRKAKFHKLRTLIGGKRRSFSVCGKRRERRRRSSRNHRKRIFRSVFFVSYSR